MGFKKNVYLNTFVFKTFYVLNIYTLNINYADMVNGRWKLIVVLHSL